MLVNRDEVWSRRGMSTEADKICKACGGACVSKNIGNICVMCIENVPAYIPNEQIVRYFRVKILL